MREEIKSAQLPQGWAKTQLSDLFIDPKSEVVDGPFGSNLKAAEYTDAGIPILRIQNIDRNKLVNKNIRYISEEKADDLSRHNYQVGDIILTKLGDPLGKACIVPPSIQRGIIVADLVRLRLTHDYIDKKWLVHVINSPVIANQLKLLTKGSTRPRVNLSHIRSLCIELPPLPEQHRIVAKIEGLFSKLNEGVAELKKAKEKLDLYRRALLKAAFEGRLTEKWRKEHADELESAEELLARIKAEREKRYHQQLEEWKQAVKEWESQGKPGKKPRRPRKPKELPPPTEEELSELPELPEGWVWVRSGLLFESVTSGSRGWAKYYSLDGAKFIRITNMDYNSLELDLSPEKIQYVKLPGNLEGTRTKIKKGDFLFSITGYLGMFAIAPDLDEAYVNQHIALVRPLPWFRKRYVGYYTISESGGRLYLEKQRKGAVKAGLTLDDIQMFPVPLCSLVEQDIIIKELTKQLERINHLTQTISSALTRAELLRQSILKKAFSGKLVPQDPNDEPASELLRRIKAEREKVAKEKKPTRKTHKKKGVQT